MSRDSKGASNKGRQVNRTELATLFGVSFPTVDGWVRNGCPHTKPLGSRSVVFNTADVANWLRDRAKEEATGNAPADEQQLKRRKMLAETEKAELELAKAKGEVAPVREFERATAGLMAVIRQNVLNVPARAVLQLLGCTDEAEFKTKLRAELVLALETAAEAEIDMDEDEDDGSDDV